MRRLILIFFIALISFSNSGQSYHLEIENDEFYRGMHSRFAILCGSTTDLRSDEITIVQHIIESYLHDSISPVILPLSVSQGGFEFSMRDDLVAIRIDVIIDDGEVVDTLSFDVNSIPAKVYVGNADSEDDTIKGIVLKAQKGLWAPVECCGFEARCAVLDYEVTVISNKGLKSTKNLGGNFSEATTDLMKTVLPGDLVMFRYIRYRCFGGDTLGQRAPDMVFTVE